MDEVIVGMGEVLWDLLPEGKKLGGAPANFAYHVSQFGFDSRVLSAVGNDPLGDEILETFRLRELRHQLSRVAFPTGTVGVTLGGNGIPQYDIREGVAWDNIPFTAETERLAVRTRAVCFGSLAQRSPVSRDTIHRFLDAMPDGKGRYRIFDINLRQHFYTKEIVEESITRCNILKINDEELVVVERMFGCEGSGLLQESCRALVSRYGLDMLILTMGEKGSYVFAPDEESFCKTPDVAVADTVGAGDSFTAAFCASLLRGRSIRDAHRTAVDVAAFVCTQSGAMPELEPELKQRAE